MSQTLDITYWKEEYRKCMADSNYLGEKYSHIEGTTLHFNLPDELVVAAILIEAEAEEVLIQSITRCPPNRTLNRLLALIQQDADGTEVV